jgi:hypothetical protein
MWNVKLPRPASASAAAIVLTACGWSAPSAAAEPNNCASLAKMAIPASAIGLPTKGATVTRAEAKPGTGKSVAPADFVPEFCMIDAVIESVNEASPDINFRLVVPTQWNGNAIQVGGNGFNGFVPRLASFIRGAAGSPMGPAMPPNRPYPIAQGYALFGSDSGHVAGNGNPPGWTPATPEDGAPPAANPTAPGAGAQGGPPPAMDFKWMGDKESFENYQHAQIKKTHDVALHLLNALKGKAPQHTYFMGESQGGRDALIAASMYGADYDGVLASVPLSFFTGLLINGAYRTKFQFDPAAYVPPAKAAALGKEVLKQCDKMDNLEDGVVNNYMSCYRRFDVSVTPKPFAGVRCADGKDTGSDCFSDGQIATLEKFFSPMVWGFPMRNGETDWPGNPIGAVATPSSPMGATGALTFLLSSQQPNPAKPGGMFSVPTMFGTMLGDPAGFDYFNKSHAELQKQVQTLSAALDAPTDWSKLLGHGGKLVYHSAGNDYLTNSRSHMRVYDQAAKRLGQAKIDQGVRFYVTPNGDHGSGGSSATTKEPTPQHIDLVTVLTNWVEKGVTPPDAVEEVLMDKNPPHAVSKSRPLCRYPRYPHYTSGDPNKMASFTCELPK